MGALRTSRLARWAGDRPICIGGYARNNDMPAGVPTDDEMQELSDLKARLEDNSANLFILAAGFPIASEAGVGFPPRNELHFVHRLSRAECDRYWALTDSLNYKDPPRVLCNMSKQEYVRQDATKDIVAASDRITCFTGEPKDFGPLLVSRICWPPEELIATRHDGRGAWAGDRFEIITLQQMESCMKNDKGWKDVTEEVQGELNAIWERDRTMLSY
ncbi:hypothetical protein BOTBODRAFT_183671 [Botryobasidium botryosum FD-172 SS1]|uniref:Uncharacterized protein n=1 Tax=Botryobasidium botryosum (strain FD-172 SS1) TaxID=930990 RepID=A0A067NB41_BOTB1|nr:hypothetical protein BOTBODRAFT_183671 [Botryobasidium botryosum FD-172 SS1]